MTQMFQSHIEQLRLLRPGTPDKCAMDPKPAPAGEERVREGEANRTQGGLQERPPSPRFRALIGPVYPRVPYRNPRPGVYPRDFRVSGDLGVFSSPRLRT